MDIPTTTSIGATQARNDFFDLLLKVHNEGRSFIIEKGQIPLARLEPIQKVPLKKQAALFARIRTFRSSLPKGHDSVKLLRKMRAEK